ncbi:MAG: hypothetical protein P4M11_15970 [Candidatus Pacebacteria bacterium]|nr:hypothetical protein [Candidatus Paceibacterota bacterium]
MLKGSSKSGDTRLNMNVRLTDFDNGTQLGKFTICTMMSVDNMMSKFINVRQDSLEEPECAPDDVANKVQSTVAHLLTPDSGPARERLGHHLFQW